MNSKKRIQKEKRKTIHKIKEYFSFELIDKVFQLQRYIFNS